MNFQRTKFLYALFFIFLTSVISSNTSASEDFPFNSIDEWLLASYKYVPSIFSEATEYDIDFSKIYEQAKTTDQILEEFRNKRRSDMIEIKVFKPQSERKQILSHPNPDRYYAKLISDPQKIKESRSKLSDTQKDLDEIANAVTLQNLKQLSVALKTVAKVDPAIWRLGDFDTLLYFNKLKWIDLQKHLKAINWEKIHIQAFQKAKDRNHFFRDLVQTIENSLLYIHRKLWKQKYFDDPSTLQELVKKIEESKFSPLAKEIYTSIIINEIKWIEDQSKDPETNTRSLVVTLREVPPWLALLRGLIGTDCASAYTAPISFLPSERTFFIYDSTDDILGYLALARTGNNSENLVLHDFAAPNINKEQITYALYGLQDTVEGKLFSISKERLYNNLNYKHIRMIIENNLRPNNIHQANYPTDFHFRDLVIKKLGITADFDSRDVFVNTPEIRVKGIQLDIDIQPVEFDPSIDNASKEQKVFVYQELISSMLTPSSKFALDKKLQLTEEPQSFQAVRIDNLKESILRSFPKNHSIKKFINFFERSYLALEKNSFVQSFGDLDNFLAQLNEAVSFSNDSRNIFWEFHRSLIYEFVLEFPNLQKLKKKAHQELVLNAFESFIIQRKLFDFVSKKTKPLQETLLEMSKWNGFDKIVFALLRENEYHLRVLEKFITYGIDIESILAKDKRKLIRLEPFIYENSTPLQETKKLIQKLKSIPCNDVFN